MKLVKNGQGVEYEAKGHTLCYVMNKLVIGKDTRKMNLGLSHFLPNGGAEMSAAPVERAYYVMSGSIKVTGKKSENFTMGPGDVVYIGPGEEREFKVLGSEPATILVMVTAVE
jgi:mannose-6-phosphate isomerase-like protein (cupin superfamily)